MLTMRTMASRKPKVTTMSYCIRKANHTLISGHSHYQKQYNDVALLKRLSCSAIHSLTMCLNLLFCMFVDRKTSDVDFPNSESG